MVSLEALLNGMTGDGQFMMMDEFAIGAPTQVAPPLYPPPTGHLPKLHNHAWPLDPVMHALLSRYSQAG